MHVGDYNQNNSAESLKHQRDILSRHISKLRRKTRFLRLLGYYIFGLSLFVLVSSILPQAIYPFITKDLADTARVATIAVAMMAMGLIVAYEYQLRVGRVLFEEISDEFQWRIRGEIGDGSGGDESDESAPLEARVSLREFARTIDLPLVPGKFGPAIYVLVNISAVAVTILLSK